MSERTIIVTGASSGIGRATARRFLQAGWQVGLIGRRPDALAETAGDAKHALLLPCDVTDPDAVQSAFTSAREKWRHIDILFNNAGQGLKSVLIDEMSVDDWHRVTDVNITGAFLCARAAFAAMRGQTPQGGRIINNGSVSAHVPRPGSIAYTASKHAITGMTRSISLDGRPFNIACGQIDIGNALTEMSASQTNGVPQADGSTRVEPTIDVSHIADAVLNMATLPLSANIQFMTIMATNMPFIGRG
ncbi:SDR family oxidoreductase [Notoacmeibacter sp. MSK16QG-6]|uniref:SDR family oxidoreductase n=1 Tax=Notoacmeibacter sp. MSK16QG-6 TaxID=2957982 RepID=UPI00209E6227|nr:SDR family oxidoreductase [Notoacmeibacter sp. MSK16QG-6]MCP1199534.1 SDR family oxidoreductase [Notoacmeibacter sp. MSK16QG-6]